MKSASSWLSYNWTYCVTKAL